MSEDLKVPLRTTERLVKNKNESRVHVSLHLEKVSLPIPLNSRP